MECDSNDNTSLDTLILYCEDTVTPKKHRHCKKHRKRKEGRTESNFKTNITQKLYMERQGYKCIINLNTTISNHQRSHSDGGEKHSTRGSGVEQAFRSSVVDRPVPHCLRQSCSHAPQHKKPEFRYPKQCKAHFHHHRNRGSHCMRTKHEHKHRHSRHHEIHTKRQKVQKGSEQKLSAKSNLSKLELSYEDISSSSLDSYVEKPKTYKNATKTKKKYVSKLDTLIKRTKERERKRVEQSRISNPWYESSLVKTEIGSMEFLASCSDIDPSLHSCSTLIIEPMYTGYSPSIETNFRIPKTESFLKSPGYEDNWSLNDLVSLKSEPKMDFEAYSPVQTE